MRRKNALFNFGLPYVRVCALNADYTQPTPDNIVGGVGPFDFSAVADNTAVVLSIKIDTVLTDLSVDMSSAVSQTAVTVDEVVSAVSSAITAESLAVTCEKDATSGRIKFSTTGSPQYLQVYGELATATEIGQGFGVKYITSDTFTSLGATPVRKDDETISTTDAHGKDTEMIKDGYNKGATLTIVDTAEDWDMCDLFEGVHEGEEGYTESGTVDTKKPFIFLEKVNAFYKQGQNYEDEIVAYKYVKYPKCKGMGGDETNERAFNNSNYTVNAITYTDADGTTHGASKRKELTNAEFKAMMFDTL